MKNGLLIAAMGTLASVASANPVLIYENDFSSALQVGPEWITNPDWNTATNFGGFLGRFGQETQTLTFDAYRPGGPGDGGGDNGGDQGDGGGSNDGPGGDGGGNGGGANGGRSAIDYTLVFDLYLFDSWDGAYAGEYGPDMFGVSANNETLLWEGWHSTKTWLNPVEPTVGPVNLGFNSQYADSIYRDMELTFSVDPAVDTIWIDFIGATSVTNLDDESWGIDNVRVYVANVPAPSSVALGSLGLVLASTRRRRSETTHA